jgi:hypothetical protein
MIPMPYRYRVLALLFILVFLMHLDRLCIAVAGPRIQHDMRLSPSQWEWVIGAFTLPGGFLGFIRRVWILGGMVGKL